MGLGSKVIQGKLYRVTKELNDALAMSGYPTKIGAWKKHHIIPKGEIVMALDFRMIGETPFQHTLDTHRYAFPIEFLARGEIFRVRIEGHTSTAWKAYFERAGLR